MKRIQSNWYGMTIHGNVWYWLIFKVTWPVGSVAATSASSTSHSDTKNANTRWTHPHDICDETAWPCMRMYDIGSYSRGVWVIYGWVAFPDMHDECIRMTRTQRMCGSLKTDLHVTGRIMRHMLFINIIY